MLTLLRSQDILAMDMACLAWDMVMVSQALHIRELVDTPTHRDHHMVLGDTELIWG